MGDVLTRKCACCKGDIEIDPHHIYDVIAFEKKYYHSACFEKMAAEKAASKRGKPQMWQEALDHLWELEAETKKTLEKYVAQDGLNKWLLEHYDIVMVPNRFWQILADLENGKYKGKHCNPVKMETLYGCWKWGQKKLNEINQYNKANNKGPANDEARIMYDLAVLVGKVPQFLKYKEQQQAAKIEMAREAMSLTDVDMSKVGRGKQVQRRDVSNISDDIFVE